MSSELFEPLVSLDASLACCATSEAVLTTVLDHLPALLPCTPSAVAEIGEDALPVVLACQPATAASEARNLLADALGRGMFALALRRGQPVLDELADGRVLVLQALATPGHLAGVLLGILPTGVVDPDRLAALALAGARSGAAHENLILHAQVIADKHDLEQRVAERTADLAAALDRAEASSRAKNSFLATMSHELRTPLNGIIGMTELLHDDDVPNARQERIAVIKACAEDLLRHIDGILNLSRIEAGRMELLPVEADPTALAMQALRTVAPTAQAKGLALALVPAAGLPRQVLIDGQRWRQVLLNLLGNAVKFTERGEIALELAAHATSDGWILTAMVTDTGLGIEPAVQARLFTPFEQGDASINRRFGGTGLGLTISRRLCELMGGTITLTSTLGTGSTFIATARAGMVAESGGTLDPGMSGNVLLRAMGGATKRAAAAALATAGLIPSEDGPWLVAIVDTASPEVSAAIAGLPRDLPIIALTPLAGPPEGFAASLIGRRHALMATPVDPIEMAVAARSLRGVAAEVAAADKIASALDNGCVGMRILCADDQAVNRLVLAGLLRQLGVTPVMAEGGAQAVELALGGTWDAVLLDCQMPEVDGFEAAARIRAAGVRAPLIAITAHAMAGDRADCLARGFDDYLAKPVRRNELAALLARCRGMAGPAPVRMAPPTRLAQLASEIGAETMTAVIAAMLADAPRLIAEVAAALAAGDLVTAGRRGHALKGDAANLGLEELSACARDLESAAGTGDAVRCRAAAEPLAGCWDRAAAVLRAVG